MDLEQEQDSIESASENHFRNLTEFYQKGPLQIKNNYEENCVDNENTTTKYEILLTNLECDTKAVDIKWSLFASAAQSYKFYSCLRPFPPQYKTIDGENIDELRSLIDSTPPLTYLLNKLKADDNNLEDSKIIDLMSWILHDQDPYFETVPKNKFDEILNLAPSSILTSGPNYIFKVKNKFNNLSEVRWKSLVDKYGTIHAYHGSRLENFYSILRNGLQQHMTKNGLYGTGVYLSNEITVSLPYSLTGLTWKNSSFGEKFSCLALCEVINHPQVLCKIDGDKDKTRTKSSDSIGGEVPEKYILVRNSDLVKVRYVFVYSKLKTRNELQLTRGVQKTGLLNWMCQHKMLLIFITYAVLLIGIGIANNTSVNRYFSRMMKKSWN